METIGKASRNPIRRGKKQAPVSVLRKRKGERPEKKRRGEA